MWRCVHFPGVDARLHLWSFVVIFSNVLQSEAFFVSLLALSGCHEGPCALLVVSSWQFLYAPLARTLVFLAPAHFPSYLCWLSTYRHFEAGAFSVSAR